MIPWRIFQYPFGLWHGESWRDVPGTEQWVWTLLSPPPRCSRGCPSLAPGVAQTSQIIWTVLLTGQQYLVRFLRAVLLWKNDVLEMPVTDLLYLHASSIKIGPLWSLRDFVYFLIVRAVSAHWAVRVDWICIEVYNRWWLCFCNQKLAGISKTTHLPSFALVTMWKCIKGIYSSKAAFTLVANLFVIRGFSATSYQWLYTFSQIHFLLPFWSARSVWSHLSQGFLSIRWITGFWLHQCARGANDETGEERLHSSSRWREKEQDLLSHQGTDQFLLTELLHQHYSLCLSFRFTGSYFNTVLKMYHLGNLAE